MNARIWTTCLCALMLALGATTHAASIVPDNGGGTADMPIRLDYYSQSPMCIVDGLPAGTNILIDAALTAPDSTLEVLGGPLLGMASAAFGSGFAWNMHGTGELAGFHRVVFVPLNSLVPSFAPDISDASFEVHAAPRTVSDPVQSFDTDMFRLSGQITGDPDFDLLRVTAGSGFNMPSPGHTTLTQVDGGNWAVDSFFDITYRIDFVGAPGSALHGRSGSTTATIRLDTQGVPEPSALALALAGALGASFLRIRRR